MKIKITILGAALVLLTAAGVFVADAGTAPCCVPSALTTTTNFTDKSLYQTDSKWTTDTGKQIKLGKLKGKPQVVVMFFANCQSACPLLVNDLKRIDAALTTEQRAQVGFTLVSFDSQRDTVEALAAYRRARALPTEGWTLLRGESDDVLELAALLGVRYQQNASNGFSHSNIITVLNAEGEIVHQQTGLNQDIQETVSLIGKLTEK